MYRGSTSLFRVKPCEERGWRKPKAGGQLKFRAAYIGNRASESYFRKAFELQKIGTKFPLVCPKS